MDADGLVVLPRKNAVPWEEGHPRNDALESIATGGGWQNGNELTIITAAVLLKMRCIVSSNYLAKLGFPYFRNPEN